MKEKLSMTLTMTHLAHILAGDSGINSGYQHKAKLVMPLEPLIVPDGILKWYGIYPQNQLIPAEVTLLARNWLTISRIDSRGMGFALLHRCENDFYFLLVCSWRNANELWESVFYKDGKTMVDFALFPSDSGHKPTFCVWELVPVWHEQQVWTRFLGSSRDEAAAQVWLHDCFAGRA